MNNILKIVIDIGEYSTKVSFLRDNKEIYLDFSGGYGEKSFLSCIFYSFEQNEFLFGEYAKNEKQYSKGVLFDNVQKLIEKDETFNLECGTFSGTEIASLYIDYILKFLKGLDPKIDFFEVIFLFKYGEIDYRKNLEKVVSKNSLIKKGIFLESILTFFYNKETLSEKYVIIDLSHTSMGIYFVQRNLDEVSLHKVKIFDDISLGNIDSEFYKMLSIAYEESVDDYSFEDFEQEKISQLVRENKNKFLNSYNKKKDVKVYYDFVTPPFAVTIKYEYILNLIEKEIYFFNKALSDVSFKDTDYKYICVGYGTRFKFIENLFKNIFGNISFHKEDFFLNSALNYFYTKNKLKLSLEVEEKFNVKNLKNDIAFGFFDKDFIPIFSKSLVNFELKLFINQYIEDALVLPLYKWEKGDLTLLCDINITYFKNRSKGTLKLKFNGKLEENVFNLYVEDLGFGDIYTKTDYNEIFKIKI